MLFFITSIIFLSHVLSECVDEAKCHDIRLNANYWKDDEYDVYNDADLIEDGLYLGNVCAAHNESWLKENNIKLVISVANEWKSDTCLYTDPSIKSLSFKLDDSNNEDESKARSILDETALIIREHLKDKMNGNVLVHCNMGISRSSAVVIRYLQLKYLKKSYRFLFNRVKARRRVIKPNNLFGRLLTELDL